MRMFNRPTLDSEKPKPTAESWWLGLSPEKFYAEAARRHPELAAKYGSAAISTFGDREPGFAERARRARENHRERLDRISA